MARKCLYVDVGGWNISLFPQLNKAIGNYLLHVGYWIFGESSIPNTQYPQTAANNRY